MVFGDRLEPKWPKQLQVVAGSHTNDVDALQAHSKNMQNAAGWICLKYLIFSWKERKAEESEK